MVFIMPAAAGIIVMFREWRKRRCVTESGLQIFHFPDHGATAWLMGTDLMQARFVEQAVTETLLRRCLRGDSVVLGKDLIAYQI